MSEAGSQRIRTFQFPIRFPFPTYGLPMFKTAS